MRRHVVGVAAALTVLAILPVTVMAASPSGYSTVLSAPSNAATSLVAPLYGVDNFDAPTVDALQRGLASDLFASFGWNAGIVRGSFVQFSIAPGGSSLDWLMVRSGANVTVVAESISFQPSAPFDTAYVNGPLFVAATPGVIINAHDDPSGLFEFRTGATPTTVFLRLAAPVSDLMSRRVGDAWPRSSLSFRVGDNAVRIILGRGTFNVTDNTVSASMAPGDFMAMKILPPFEPQQESRTALLDVFGAGRLAAEFALISDSEGGWIQNSARFRMSLVMSNLSLAEQHARVSLRSRLNWSGLVLFAFDPQTMPADATHRLVVTANGTELAQAPDPISALYGPLPTSPGSLYARLPGNATVLAIYLTGYRNVTVTITSLVVPPRPADWGSQLAAVAAVAVVSAAAALMFRRKDE